MANNQKPKPEKPINLPEVTVKAKAIKRPAVTNNPNDPRLKAYNDSLKLSQQYPERKGGHNIKKGSDRGGMMSFNDLVNDRGDYGVNKQNVNRKIKPVAFNYADNHIVRPVYKKPTTPIKYEKPVVKKAVTPVVKPIVKRDTVATPKLNTPDTKVKLYPRGEASAKSVDSLKKVGYGKAIGNPIVKKGQAPMYGAASSDVIKKALQPKKLSAAKPKTLISKK